MPFSWLSQLGGQWLASHGGAVAAVFGSCALLWLVVDLVVPASDTRRRGRAACLSLAVLAFLVGCIRFSYDPSTAKVLILLGHLLLAGYLARFGWNGCDGSRRTRGARYAAWGVLAATTLLKMSHLRAWPQILTDYAAMNGVAALPSEHGWRDSIWLGQPNDLQSGGSSPLHFPVLWTLYRIAGPNPFSVRLAEVVGSTFALVFLWLWLSRALPGWWAVAALALVSFSPEHLAQSRMGTFQSASLAVALALLWLADRVAHPPPARWYWWGGLGLAAALIGYGYAPLRILYPLVAGVLIIHVASQPRAARTWLTALVAVVPLTVALAVQTFGTGGAARMFQGGALATDAPIWKKASEDVVATQLQPWPVVAANFRANAVMFFDWLYEERRQQVLFGPACGFGALFAVASIVRGWGWVAPVYYLLGLLPPLLVHPVMRRGFVMQPLVLVAAVLFFQGYLIDSERLIRERWWRLICRAVVAAGLACTALYGLHQFAAENGPVGISPTFGTIYRQRLIERLLTVLPTHHIVLLNPVSIRQGLEMELYEPARQLGNGPRYEFAQVNRGSDPQHYLRAGEPVCFAYLEESDRSWIAGWLQEKLPGCRLEQPRAEGTGRIMYTLFFCDRTASPPI